MNSCSNGNRSDGRHQDLLFSGSFLISNSTQIHCYSLLQECLQDVNLKLQGVYALFSCVHTCWAIVQWGVSLSKKQSWAFTGRHFYNGCHLFWRLALFIWLSGTAEDIKYPTHNKWKFRASSSSASSMLPGWIAHTGFMWWKEHSNS